MAKKTRESVFEEVEQRLVRLGLPDDVRDAIMAQVHEGLGHPGEGSAGTAQFPILVARIFTRTAQRAMDALGSASLSMLIMLFDLFVAHEQGRTVSVSSLCIASGAASTTALRQIGQLEMRGLVTRREDERDRRRTWVSPTPRGLDLIRGLMADWAAVLSG